MTLEELRDKYPLRTGMRYEPAAGCWWCLGEGEVERNGNTRPCICVYMAGARRFLSEVASQAGGGGGEKALGV